MTAEAFDGITSAYRLQRRELSPTQLLLDPNNPRLITEMSQHREYSMSDIIDPNVQEYVRELVCKKEHAVQRLVERIGSMGFIGGIHEMIVKRVTIDDRYLVVEGNRRTAALQQLLSRSQLPAEVSATIQRIPVQEFTYVPNRRYDEDQVVEFLLGTIHIEGPKEWGALEKAHYIHRSYLRQLALPGGGFYYDAAVAARVGDTFKMSNKAVKANLVICRVYEQLRLAKMPVEPKHYSLIDLATKTRAVAREFFELDDLKCELSNAGLERFDKLFLRPGAPIHNPNLFRDWVFVYQNGTEHQRMQALEGERTIEELVGAVRSQKKRRAFREDLERITADLRELNVSDFNGTLAEKDEIRRIYRLVAERLVKLL